MENTDSVLVAELLRDFAQRAYKESDKAYARFRLFDRFARELEDEIYSRVYKVERSLDRGR